MDNSANKIIPMMADNASAVQTAVVESILSDGAAVTIAGHLKTAKKAFSCLVDLVPGDQVICARNSDGMVYILGIIARPGSQKMKLSFPSDATMQSLKGGVGIHAHDNVTVTSANMNFISQKSVHKSSDACISFDHATVTGMELQASFKSVRFVSDLIITMAKQGIDRFKGYVRTTRDADMVKSGQMIRQTDGLYAMDSTHTVMNSRKSTKIDGDKILMG
jgi:hypothetical protein